MQYSESVYDEIKIQIGPRNPFELKWGKTVCHKRNLTLTKSHTNVSTVIRRNVVCQINSPFSPAGGRYKIRIARAMCYVL